MRLSQWIRSVFSLRAAAKGLAGLPYRGASVSVNTKGRLRAHPAQSVGEAKRNLQRLARVKQAR